MYFELTFDHKFSLYCASFKAFSLYTAPEERHRLRVSLFIHYIANAGPESVVITHQQHTERKLCYLITDPTQIHLPSSRPGLAESALTAFLQPT